MMRLRSSLLSVALLGVTVLVPATLQKGGLRATGFPDGTGSLGLPAGWSIANAYRGQVSAENGKGEVVVLGFPWTILKTGTSLDEFDNGTAPKARAGDMLRALGEVLAKNGGQRLLSVRSRAAPKAVAGAPAAYLLYEFQSQGQTLTGLGYFTALDPGPTSPSWTLYCSVVIAPKARFTKSLPTMMAIWKSWRSNGADPLRGSQSEMLDKVLAGRRDSYQKVQEQFRKGL